MFFVNNALAPTTDVSDLPLAGVAIHEVQEVGQGLVITGLLGILLRGPTCRQELPVVLVEALRL